MPFQILCTHCQASIKVADTLRGKSIRCPSCQLPVKVPTAQTTRMQGPARPVAARPIPKNTALGEDRRPTMLPPREPEYVEDDRPRPPRRRDDDEPRRYRERAKSGAALFWVLLTLVVLVLLAGTGAGTYYLTRPDSNAQVNSPSRADEEIAQLKKQNEALKKSIEEARKRAEAREPGPQLDEKKGDVASSDKAHRTASANNLKQLALAMHSYHDAYKQIPTAATVDRARKEGKPLLSWRVAMLPYLEEAPLYHQFKHDEPWDSPHNIKLLSRMPAIYAPPPGVKTKAPHTTFYQVIVGPGTAFEKNPDAPWMNIFATLATIPDGTSNTIAIVEAAEPVPWTKPEDLVYDPKGPLPKMGGTLFRDGFNCALMDGSARFIKPAPPGVSPQDAAKSGQVSQETLRIAITCADGMVFAMDWGSAEFARPQPEESSKDPGKKPQPEASSKDPGEKPQLEVKRQKPVEEPDKDPGKKLGEESRTEPEAKPAEKTKVERKKLEPRVQAAVDKGIAFLRAELVRDNKQRPGAIGLLGLALLECGVNPDDADVEKAANLVRAAGPTLNNPYDIAPAIFLLDRLSRDAGPTEADRKLMNSLGLRLIAGQRRPFHLWRYQVPVLSAEQEEKLKEDIEKKTFQGPVINDQDMSCSQFAALGLWVAQRHAIAQKSGFIPLEVATVDALATAGVQAKEQQAPGGTWNYGAGDAGGQFKDTATCCGLILLSLGEAVKKNPRSLVKDAGAIRALEHLERVIKNNPDPRKSRFDSHGNYYFLWALQRAALILGQDKIGGEDWHRWGTEFILTNQLANGSWNGGNGTVPDTAFALFFLVRSDLFQDLTERIKVN